MKRTPHPVLSKPDLLTSVRQRQAGIHLHTRWTYRVISLEQPESPRRPGRHVGTMQ